MPPVHSTADDRFRTPVEASADGITATYRETDEERLRIFASDGGSAAVAQNIERYAMLKVRPTADGDELERYYGFDMALDHAAELLGVSPYVLPVPDPAPTLDYRSSRAPRRRPVNCHLTYRGIGQCQLPVALTGK